MGALHNVIHVLRPKSHLCQHTVLLLECYFPKIHTHKELFPPPKKAWGIKIIPNLFSHCFSCWNPVALNLNKWLSWPGKLRIYTNVQSEFFFLNRQTFAFSFFVSRSLISPSLFLIVESRTPKLQICYIFTDIQNWGCIGRSLLHNHSDCKQRQQKTWLGQLYLRLFSSKLTQDSIAVDKSQQQCSHFASCTTEYFQQYWMTCYRCHTVCDFKYYK